LRASAEALAAASGVHVAWREDAQLPATLTMDETLVERAVMNVVTNAVEFASAGSTVEVDVRGEGDDVTLSVSDAGPGFSPEALRRGCERFYQGDPARSDRGHSGLGLHVAAEAAERHGGTVELANREDAPGARVTLRLPRA
uniref:sensor histidine kinase n=3 Tax=Eggerthella TaxID=84111 RepID=UPI00248E0145